MLTYDFRIQKTRNLSFRSGQTTSKPPETEKKLGVRICSWKTIAILASQFEINYMAVPRGRRTIRSSLVPVRPVV
ncbi:hypothetical protein TNCV_1243381 [Trichonephila clavipes]|nr:hypothetical protein TNCV_1243381 [Trichonephila clavipes]